MDPLTKRLALIACGLGGALVVVVGGWSMIGHHSGAVPVVQAESGPIRVKPVNPGGMQITGANDDILSGGNSGDDKLAPPPEVPEPQALRAASVPAPAPAPAPMVARAPGITPVPPSMVAAKPVDAKPIAAAAPDHAAPTGKGALVQLAAVRSEADAKSEWDRLSKRMPDLLAQRHPAISKIDRDGQTLWRVRTGGFADITQAKDF
jgi:cell division septation protein DedD